MKTNTYFTPGRDLFRTGYFFFFVYLLLCVCPVRAAAPHPALKIRGENYGVLSLAQGQQPFFNRTNMSFGAVPSAYSEWQFTKINANSIYLPGPLPTLEVKADAAGYLTVMVATNEKPEVCARWAEDNGWEWIEGPSLSYIAGASGVLSFFQKPIQPDTWVQVVQPATFSGAIVIAPSITEEGMVEVLPAVPVRITALGWMETDRFVYNVQAYANRAYVFTRSPVPLTGLQFTRYNGGDVPTLRITAEETGMMYIAASEVETAYLPTEKGWTKVSGLDFSYSDNLGTTFTVYQKAVQKGDTMRISTTSWTGILVFSSEISYSNFQHLAPPPGRVIHNSKAVTKKFVGSPSIVVLEDGTYLASHDYFGGFISDAFVYRSLDKGETWERIAALKTLNWAKLFTRGSELYLMGVAPRVTIGYGNIVILRSQDGGYTWSTPADSKSGLLKEGFYHCAPTPVTFHDGRIWKAMEDQGRADGWGPFSAFMLSVDENADLLDAANWRCSNSLLYTPGAVDASTWLEGNAVVGKDGRIKNVLRLHYLKDDKAAVASVSADGTEMTYDPLTGIADLPGALKKFTIRYDSLTQRYWTLSNYVLAQDREGTNVERARNTIVLAYSDDLYHWVIKDTLLHHPNLDTHGFQYLDWLFEGHDIIAVSRTAWDDETGSADNQHNANFLTFHRFRNFRYERPASEQGVRVARWYKNAKSALALTFDDGFEAHAKYAFPLLQKYNLQGTFFVSSGYLVKRGETQKERYGFWEDFSEMSDQGHEIASHSVHHLNLTTLDPDVLYEELEKDKAAIESFTGKPCLTHAYPYCLHHEVVDQAAASSFLAARQCGGFENEIPTSPGGWFSVNSDLSTWTYSRSLQHEKESVVAFQEKVARLNGKFGIVCVHETLPFSQLETSSTYEIATTEWLDAVCAFLSDPQVADTIWTTTFSNLVRYTQERENLRVYTQELPDGSMRYEFTTWLDSSVYNLPLTLECRLPEGWNRVQCLVYEAEKVVLDSLCVVENAKIVVNVIPDRQSLVVVDHTPQEELVAEHTAEYVVYPNPASEVVHVKNIDTEVRCEVYSAKGYLLRTGLLQPASGGVQVSLGGLKAGLYLVRLYGSDDRPSYSFQIVKK